MVHKTKRVNKVQCLQDTKPTGPLFLKIHWFSYENHTFLFCLFEKTEKLKCQWSLATPNFMHFYKFEIPENSHRTLQEP